MEKSLNILLAMFWQVESSLKIADGFVDYLCTKDNWIVNRTSLKNTQPGVIDWSSIAGLLLTGGAYIHPEVLDLPIAVVLAHWAPELKNIYQVGTDPVSVGVCAADHLIKGGYRYMATLSRMPIHELAIRADAFAEHCIRNECSCERFIVRDQVSAPIDWQTYHLPNEPLSGLIDWIGSGDLPVAVFCSEDRTGVALIKALKDAGLHIPEDVAVLGCEDSRLECEGVRPALSSVCPPYRQIGFEAARLLDAQLNGKKLKKRQIYFSAEKITERMSTSVFSTSDPQLRRAVEFIRRNACKNLSVEDAAHHAGLTLRTLQRRFKEEVGHGPNEEFQRVRLEKAKLLLRDTNLPLEEIAEASGYQSGHYLSRIFKDKIGTTTRQYRNRYPR